MERVWGEMLFFGRFPGIASALFTVGGPVPSAAPDAGGTRETRMSGEEHTEGEPILAHPGQGHGRSRETPVSPDGSPGVTATTRAPQQRSALRSRSAAGGVVIAVVASVAAGAGLAEGSRTAFVLPIVAAGILCLAALAAARFEFFVAVILLVRASLDATKVTSSSADVTGAISVLFIMAGAVWLAGQRAEHDVEPSPFAVPFAALVLAGALSIFSSHFPLSSAIESIRIGTVVVIFAVLNRLLASWRQIRLIVAAVFMSSIVPIATASYQLLKGLAHPYPGGFARVQSTFVHPNPFAAYLVLLAVLGAAIYPYLQKRSRPWMLALLACYGGLLIATYTRGAWIAAIAGMVVVGLLQQKRLLAILAVTIVVLVITVPSIGGRLADLSEQQKPSAAAGNSLVWRFRYWEETLSLQTNPLLGIGLRSVELSTAAEKAPHNDLIRVYVETGIIGLLAYTWLLIVLVREARRALARAAPGLARGLAAGFSGALTGFLLLSLVGNLISQLVILWYFATIAATAVAASRLASEHPTVAA